MTRLLWVRLLRVHACHNACRILLGFQEPGGRPRQQRQALRNGADGGCMRKSGAQQQFHDLSGQAQDARLA